ncbi:MAG TPA: ATP-binding cassette domain-containing protein [Thermoplasmata archaeon]|nr:ATP-binding cassette domain-containing protein [Thermoplasmata archaeon]
MSKPAAAAATGRKVITKTDAILLVKDLKKTFDPDVRAVDGISFYVKRGEVFGFLCPNGAGKSTTIKIITTLLQKTAGTVFVDGLDLEGEPAKIREIIGYAAQDVGVDDDLTGRENLRLQARFYHIPRAEMDPRVNLIIKTVGLEDAADRRAGTYSGGMRRRLDLAMALISKPKLLFLDEPTTGLDPQNRISVWNYIKSLNDQGMTIFLTTQYMEEADRLCDRLCIIDLGKIVAQGTPASLKAEIGADVIQIALKSDGAKNVRDVAREGLRRIPGIQEVQNYDAGVTVYAKSGPSLVPQIVRMLDDVGVQISQLTLSAPSLDDVFLKHTGHQMRSEEVKPPSRMMWGARRRRAM